MTKTNNTHIERRILVEIWELVSPAIYTVHFKCVSSLVLIYFKPSLDIYSSSGPMINEINQTLNDCSLIMQASGSHGDK